MKIVYCCVWVKTMLINLFKMSIIELEQTQSLSLASL